MLWKVVGHETPRDGPPWRFRARQGTPGEGPIVGLPNVWRLEAWGHGFPAPWSSVTSAQFGAIFEALQICPQKSHPTQRPESNPTLDLSISQMRSKTKTGLMAEA